MFSFLPFFSNLSLSLQNQHISIHPFVLSNNVFKNKSKQRSLDINEATYFRRHEET